MTTKKQQPLTIAIASPPLKGPGVPLLSQNRQFQWYRSPVTSYTIYPVVPAYAATFLQSKGYRVQWMDYVAEKKSYEEFLRDMGERDIDIIAIETKTPVVQQHWRIINDIKKRYPSMTCVLMGDHVTALPHESFEHSNVDYVLAGGDFDFRLLGLVSHLDGTNKTWGQGIYYRDKNGTIVSTGGDKRGNNLTKLPMIDRQLTKWWLYSGDNGNFKYKPNTYTMIGRDCWWRRPSKDGKAGCTFCSWTSIFPTWRTGTPTQLLDEIGHLIDIGVKEVFDDTGTFPVGDWLKEFCAGMVSRGYSSKIIFGCNMRAGALKQSEFRMMKKAGFRFILYGLESVNQKTIDRLNKGTTVVALEQSVKWAKKAGLAPHITIMFGYPWETKEDAERTVAFAQKLYREGAIDTLQATILMPYPGTALYDEAVKNKWLRFTDYSRYDMGEPVLTCPISDDDLKKIVQDCYHAFWSPAYIVRRILEIRSFHDVTFLTFLGMKYISKLLDFRKKTV